MIGLPIGSTPIGWDIFQMNSESPNIILNGTINYGFSFPFPRLLDTYLDFGAITNDDTYVQVNLTNTLNGLPINAVSVDVNFYARHAPAVSIFNPTAYIIAGGFNFFIPQADIADLSIGEYPWVAIATMSDGTKKTVNCGDQKLTTGKMFIVERP